MVKASEVIAREALELLWRQWATLGAYVTARPTRSVVMDPEAALVATCSILGRRDPRLFDEVLEWLLINCELIRPDRVRGLLNNWDEDTARVLAAVADFTAEVTGKGFMEGILEEERTRYEARGRPTDENLFTVGAKGNPSASNAEPAFLKWGLRRSKVRLREHAGTPDLENPANMMLLMRVRYGKSARAEILTYMLTGEQGSSYHIADMTGYNQSTIIRHLKQMSKGGPVAATGTGKGKRYILEEADLLLASWSHGAGVKMPVFTNWTFVMHSFADAAKTSMKIESGTLPEVLRVENLLDLSDRVVPRIKSAGKPTRTVRGPKPERLRGPHGIEELVAYFSRVASAVNVVLGQEI